MKLTTQKLTIRSKRTSNIVQQKHWINYALLCHFSIIENALTSKLSLSGCDALSQAHLNIVILCFHFVAFCLFVFSSGGCVYQSSPQVTSQSCKGIKFADNGINDRAAVYATKAFVCNVSNLLPSRRHSALNAINHKTMDSIVNCTYSLQEENMKENCFLKQYCRSIIWIQYTLLYLFPYAYTYHFTTFICKPM